MTKPLIGLTLDAEAAGGYAEMPWYAIRENYCDAVAPGGVIEGIETTGHRFRLKTLDVAKTRQIIQTWESRH